MKNKYSCIENILFPPTYLNIKKLEKMLLNKTVLITGASYGIGASLVYLLSNFKIDLILVARTESKLLAMKKALKNRACSIVVFPVNLSNNKEIESLLMKIESFDGGVDIFVNNAGKSIKRSVFDSLNRFHDFSRTMNLNYYAPVKLLLGLIPVLQKNKGQIINISGINVLLAPVPNWSAYQASKSAFDNWFRCASPELRANEITTTSIYLPLVKTRMISPTKAYRNMPAMSSRHVAKIIGKAMTSKRSRFAPWWLVFGELASVIFRKPIEFFSRKLLKK